VKEPHCVSFLGLKSNFVKLKNKREWFFAGSYICESFVAAKACHRQF
jgi:hypothetical protein